DSCCRCGCLSFFFFFQAEDGIRDWSVTGVQTCALPISLAAHLEAEPDGRLADRLRSPWVAAGVAVAAGALAVASWWGGATLLAEIGRASCRERGEMSGVEVSVEKNEEWREAERGVGALR